MVNPEQESFRPFDLTEAAGVIRQFGKTAKSLEEVADATAKHLYECLRTEPLLQPASVLVRFFYITEYERLESRLKRLLLKSHGELQKTDKCMVLLGTAGAQDDWTSRQSSRGHQAIPLLSPEMVAESPMIARLLTQLGIDISSLLKRERDRKEMFITPEEKDYNIFYIPEASGSPYIPAQQEFVAPHGVRSVIGFGSTLAGGEVFAVIMFFRVHVPISFVSKFKSLALSTTIAVLSCISKRLFKANSQ